MSKVRTTMSVGLSIFLASLVLAIVYFYSVTQDRWNWRKITRLGVITLGSASVLAALVIFHNAPHKQTDYADLRLGMAMTEVRYVKGDPTVVYAKESDKLSFRGSSLPIFNIIKVASFKEGQRVEEYEAWGYVNDEQTGHQSLLQVYFDPATRTVSEITCSSSGTMNCPPLLGIQDGASEDFLVEKLGRPSAEAITDVTNTKEMDYESLGARFYLQKRKVIWITVTSKSLLP